MIWLNKFLKKKINRFLILFLILIIQWTNTNHNYKIYKTKNGKILGEVKQKNLL